MIINNFASEGVTHIYNIQQSLEAYRVSRNQAISKLLIRNGKLFMVHLIKPAALIFKFFLTHEAKLKTVQDLQNAELKILADLRLKREQVNIKQ